MPTLSLAHFQVDVTPPLGAPILGIGCKRAALIGSRLELRGLVLLGLDLPIVFACIDWVGIGNDSYAYWRRLLADAAGTDPGRIIFSTIHQHSAPMEDLGADGILEATGNFSMPTIDRTFHAACIHRTAAALHESIAKATPVTHVGTSSAPVLDIASNRRILGPDGKVRVTRWSRAGAQPEMAVEPTGLIDPLLRTILFWNHDRPIATLSCYATHPIGYFADGEVNWDFVGMARLARQQEDPGVFQVYATGCAGNLGPGKFNPGTVESRAAMARRLTDAMQSASNSAQRTPIERAEFRSIALPLAARVGDEFDRGHLLALVHNAGADPYERVRAAYALAWQRSCMAGHQCLLPALHLNDAVIALLPGEPFVEYQLAAQSLRTSANIMVMGYGDYGPVYIPTDTAFDQGGYEPGGWCFTPRGCESIVMDALAKAVC